MHMNKAEILQVYSTLGVTQPDLKTTYNND